MVNEGSQPTVNDTQRWWWWMMTDVETRIQYTWKSILGFTRICIVDQESPLEITNPKLDPCIYFTKTYQGNEAFKTGTIFKISMYWYHRYLRGSYISIACITRLNKDIECLAWRWDVFWHGCEHQRCLRPFLIGVSINLCWVFDIIDVKTLCRNPSQSNTGKYIVTEQLIMYIYIYSDKNQRQEWQRLFWVSKSATGFMIFLGSGLPK